MNETMAGVAMWLWRAAASRPTARALTFLADGETESARFTYSELAARVRALASHLTAAGRSRQPVILLFPAGLEFIVALLACLESGVIAVPVAVSRAGREDPVLDQLARETGARCVLSTAALRERLARPDSAGPTLTWEDVSLLEIDIVPVVNDAPAVWPPETPAIIQYTSGSTSEPKGVVITHGNLAANEASIAAVMGHGPDLVGVGWLPHFHDMGLVGNILQTLYVGGHLVLLPPTTMVQSPLRWLAAISRYQATTSGGPNFAYDWCVQKIPPQQRTGLDLSRWRVAFIGAEPVHASTLERFAAAFAPNGFRPTAWLPCYGLAEATLLVTGTTGVQTTSVDQAALQSQRWVPCDPSHSRARAIVSCGPAAPGVNVVLRALKGTGLVAPGEIGEILVSGPAVATGYWNNAKATTGRFAVKVLGRDERFLVTGDLGVWTPNGLHVLGRSHEMIIVRGHNLFPEDLEFTAQRADSALIPGGVAVFGIELEANEAIVIVAEVQRSALRTLVPEITAQRIARAIAESHGVAPHEVVLVRPGRVSRTTSGKIQRQANREAYLDGRLELLFSLPSGNLSQPSVLDPAKLSRDQLLAASSARQPKLIVARLKAQVALLSGCDPLEIEADQNLLALGLDSLQLLEIKVGLDELAGQDLPIDAFLDAGTLAALAEQVIKIGNLESVPAPAPLATVSHLISSASALAVPLSSSQCPFSDGAGPSDSPAPQSSVPPAPSSAGRCAPGPTPAEIEAEIGQLSRDFPATCSSSRGGTVRS